MRVSEMLTLTSLTPMAVVASRRAAPDKRRISSSPIRRGVSSALNHSGRLEANRMAIVGHRDAVLGRRIELVSPGYRSKAEIASAKARDVVDRNDVSLPIGGTDTASVRTSLGQIQHSSSLDR